WSGAIGFINGLFYAMFGATDRQKTSATVMGAGALANVALNIALIPLYGHTGAAVATVLTQGVCFVVSLHLLADEFHLAIHRAFSRPLVASLCMATVMYGFDRMHLVASIAVGALSYFIVLYRIGGLSESDHEILARLIRRHP
ncbi:MAG: polysaccharide biosynthesis C-terminal domain-containing protein, partial [Dehalococcoidia bacterium]